MSEIENDHPDTKAGNRRRPCANCHGTGTDEYTEWGRIGPSWSVPPTLELPCSRCGQFYAVDDGQFVCWFCGDERAFDRREWALNRLSDDAYIVDGKPGVYMGTCPVCGEETSVNGGPDGELECDACHDFYAGQYSTEWWLYPLWESRYDTGVVVVDD